MKLRLRGNTIRLRLGQQEVQRLGQGEAIIENVPLGPGSAFVYSLAPQEVQSITTRIHNNHLEISLPREQARLWAASGEVGIAHESNWPGASLSLLIEKDFQCVQRRDNVEDADTWPHP
jgi:hypothetical protein